MAGVDHEYIKAAKERMVSLLDELDKILQNMLQSLILPFSKLYFHVHILRKSSAQER